MNNFHIKRFLVTAFCLTVSGKAGFIAIFSLLISSAKFIRRKHNFIILSIFIYFCIKKEMTLIIIIITCVVSILAFGNSGLFEKLQFNPYKVYHNKQYYRLFTHALVHADWVHLFINMFVLWQFGAVLESYYLPRIPLFGIFEVPAYAYYIFMYVCSVIIASLTTLFKYKDVYYYNSVGASGAVAAVLFACIFFDPWMKLGIFFVIPMPGIIFGVLYLWYSNYMSKRSGDNINHDAHFLGAMFGFTFPILLNPRLFYEFIYQLINPHF